MYEYPNPGNGKYSLKTLKNTQHTQNNFQMRSHSKNQLVGGVAHGEQLVFISLHLALRATSVEGVRRRPGGPAKDIQRMQCYLHLHTTSYERTCTSRDMAGIMYALHAVQETFYNCLRLTSYSA